jgi:hypothetical protein
VFLLSEIYVKITHSITHRQYINNVLTAFDRRIRTPLLYTYSSCLAGQTSELEEIIAADYFF